MPGDALTMGHYYWAARQCLKLLRPGSRLEAVAIEGASPLDPMAATEQGPDGDSTGEYLVDIAENYGDATPGAADKSSTVSSSTRRRVPTSPGKVADLKNTLEGFGRRLRSSATTAPDSCNSAPLMMPSSRR